MGVWVGEWVGLGWGHQRHNNKVLIQLTRYPPVTASVSLNYGDGRRRWTSPFFLFLFQGVFEMLVNAPGGVINLCRCTYSAQSTLFGAFDTNTNAVIDPVGIDIPWSNSLQTSAAVTTLKAGP